MFRAAATLLGIKPKATPVEERGLSFQQWFNNTPLGPPNFYVSDDAPAHVVAMQLSAFHACCRVIAETVASLPVRVIKKDGASRVPATDHPVYRLLHDRPNPTQSSFEFVETLLVHTVIWGNAYAVKHFDGDGKVEAMYIVHPSLVTPQLLEDRSIAYDVMSPDGAEARRVSSDRMLHVRYLSDDGVTGMVPCRLAKNVLDLCRAMDLQARSHFQNMAIPGVVLQTSQPISEPAMAALRKQWEELHRGGANASRTAILPNGVTMQERPVASSRDSEWTATRAFLVEEICRQMRVPPSMVMVQATSGNAEQESINFLSCVTPWCRRLESAFERSLLIPEELDTYSIRLSVQSLLRPDATTRSAFYASLFNISAITPNEIRALEDLPPLEDELADQAFVPTNNLWPMSKLDDFYSMQALGGSADATGVEPLSTPPSDAPAGFETPPAGEVPSEGGTKSRQRDSRGRFIAATQEVNDAT